MKISRSMFLFSLLNLIGTIIFICFLPTTVIFGITGNFYASEIINRWYNIIIPIVQVGATLTIYLIDVIRPKEHRYRYLTAWVAISFTTFVAWVLMFLQYHNFEIGVKLDWPWTIIILFPFALFMLAEGYYTTNKGMDDFSIFGYKWVRASSLVWKRTHEVAGMTMRITAISWIAIAIINELIWHTWWILLVAVLIWVIVYFLMTYCCARNYGSRFGTL